MTKAELVRGLGPLRPTYARELVLARTYFDLPRLLGLAFRQHRREKRMSQRAYAEFRGWSKGRQGRLETAAGELRLDVLADALDGTGFALAVVREDCGGAVPTQVLAPLTGQSEVWLDSEFIAQDDADRRFPAHVEVRRTVHPPWWWQRLYSTSRTFGPEWTTEEQLATQRVADHSRVGIAQFVHSEREQPVNREGGAT